MKIYRADNYGDLSKKAGEILGAVIALYPDSVLGLATGSTPVGAYEILVQKYREGLLDFSEIKTMNLDEYQGLGREDEQSYAYFMEKHLFSKVNIRRENTYIPDGTNLDEKAACEAYEAVLKRLGAPRIQLLGLGHDGHIAFNEPGKSFPEGVHCAELNARTIQANKRFFEKEEDVPRRSYTMGIGNIMRAKSILMLVSGAEKADIFREMLYGPVTPRVPASVLRFHPDVTIIADAAACGKL